MKKTPSIKDIPKKLRSILQKLRPFVVLIFILIVAVLYGFLVFRVKTLANKEPSDDSVQDKLQTVQRPRIDTSTLNKIQQLQDNSVDVQALFKQARDNPFQE